MNNRVTLKNLLSSVFLQIITALSGLLLPHFFITTYGSSINGMVSSLNQVLAYFALVETGISASAIAELYKPLSENNIERQNYILSATRKFYLQSGLIYTFLLLLLTAGYPLILHDQVDQMVTRAMILVLSGSNLFDYYILGKYRVLLSADQKVSIINNVQSVGLFLNMIVSVILIMHEVSVVLVKLTATIVYILRSIYLIIYVKKNYKTVDFNIVTDSHALPQRWDALFHQIVGVVCNNTDIILITLFLGVNSLKEASVYYVFSLAPNMFTSFANSISNAITPSFGKVYYENKSELIKNYNTFEFFYFVFLFAFYSVLFSLLLPFVSLYTKGVVDVDYYRPILAFLFSMMGLTQNIRVPALSMICAAGHFKQTKYRALSEAVINILVTIILIRRYGIAGAVIGTIFSYLYRSIDSIIYVSNKLKLKNLKTSIIRILINLFALLIITLFYGQVLKPAINNWENFIIWGFIFTFLSFLVISSVNCLLEPQLIKKIYYHLRKTPN